MHTRVCKQFTLKGEVPVRVQFSADSGERSCILQFVFAREKDLDLGNLVVVLLCSF